MQLEAARATPALCRFNYNAMPSLTSLNLSIAILELLRFFAADTLLCAMALTFDLEHLQRIACDVMRLCTKFERNRAIRGGVIVISVFDIITLNIF